MTVFKSIGFILITVTLSIFLLQSRSTAQSSANLQADIFSLRTEVSRLRSEVAQLRGQRGSTVPTPTPARSRSPQLNDGQIIDRLATLAIEAKDRLNALEARMTRLENRV